MIFRLKISTCTDGEKVLCLPEHQVPNLIPRTFMNFVTSPITCFRPFLWQHFYIRLIGKVNMYENPCKVIWVTLCIETTKTIVSISCLFFAWLLGEDIFHIFSKTNLIVIIIYNHFAKECDKCRDSMGGCVQLTL